MFANTKEFDICVTGGGVSGTVAAIAAARSNAKTLLVEQHGFLGGSLTSMGVGPMMSFHNPSGMQVVAGIAQEIINRLVARGASCGHVIDSTTYCSTVTPFDSEYLKVELEQLALEVGVEILYHTKLAEVMTKARQIEAISVCNKAGLSMIKSHYWIDASGDGDLSARAGVPFDLGRPKDSKTQPMTMNLKVGNIDRSAILRAIENQPINFVFEKSTEQGLKNLRLSDRISICGFLNEWNLAKKKGEIDIPRDNVLLFESAVSGVFIFNTTRVQGYDATDPYDLSKAEIEGRRQCLQLFQFIKKYLPGCKDAIRIDSSAQIGVRESRHMRGIYRLEKEDLLQQTIFHDTIACGAYPVDIHSPDLGSTETLQIQETGAYSIPLRCLIPNELDNLFFAGRNLSASYEASAAVRVTPIAMAIGQGVGTAAALASQKNLPNHSVDVREVQEKLFSAGAILPITLKEVKP